MIYYQFILWVFSSSYLYRVNQLLSFATTMLTDESSTLGLPDFPIDNLSAAVEIMVYHMYSSILFIILSCYDVRYVIIYMYFEIVFSFNDFS